jgi:hypothetical protein
MGAGAVSLADFRTTCSPVFRLVLPREKCDRLAQRVGALTPRATCATPGCGAEGLAVLLVDAEVEAVLCPSHQLVGLDGAPVDGQPMLALAAW